MLLLYKSPSLIGIRVFSDSAPGDYELMHEHLKPLLTGQHVSVEGSTMIRPRTVPGFLRTKDLTKECCKPILALARNLVQPWDFVGFSAEACFRVNYYDVVDVPIGAHPDKLERTLHVDVSGDEPSEYWLVTFIVLRSWGDYKPSDGKHLFVAPDQLEIPPTDDARDFYDIYMFPCRTTVHGTTPWSESARGRRISISLVLAFRTDVWTQWQKTLHF